MEKPELFSKVPRERLYQGVAGQIQDLVVAGTLKVGDKLPSEAELGEQFGVSRTVIREATRSLVQRGLLSSEPGRGTFVTAMSPKDLSDSFGLFVKGSDISTKKLIEVRELLEVKIAELAAERAKPEHLAKMRQAIEDMDEAIDSLDEFISADLDFHMALAEATQNDIFVALIGFLVDELQYIRRASADLPSGFLNAQGYHKRIYECVRKRDSRGATENMRQHLQQVLRRLID